MMARRRMSARQRMFFGKRSRRAGRRGFWKRSRGGGGSLGIGSAFQLDAMAYGAVRPWAATLISPVTGMIGGILPIGEITDEVALGVLNFVVAKNSSGMIRNVAMKGLTVENARVGEYFGSMVTGAGSKTVQGYVYG